MKATVVRYATKRDRTNENAELVADVFDELETAQPEHVQYLCVRIGDEFIHIVIDDSDVIPTLSAFHKFAEAIRERATSEPAVEDASLIGAHGW